MYRMLSTMGMVGVILVVATIVTVKFTKHDATEEIDSTVNNLSARLSEKQVSLGECALRAVIKSLDTQPADRKSRSDSMRVELQLSCESLYVDALREDPDAAALVLRRSIIDGIEEYEHAKIEKNG